MTPSRNWGSRPRANQCRSISRKTTTATTSDAQGRISATARTIGPRRPRQTQAPRRPVADGARSHCFRSAGLLQDRRALLDLALIALGLVQAVGVLLEVLAGGRGARAAGARAARTGAAGAAGA